jgi:hypothetical protein
MAVELNCRAKAEPSAAGKATAGKLAKAQDVHPGGEVKHGAWMQFLRGAAFVVYFGLSCVAYVVLLLIPPMKQPTAAS